MQRDEFLAPSLSRLRIKGRSPAIVEPNVAASGPAELLKPLAERAEPSLCLWIVLRNRHQDPDPAHLIGLLRARRDRPRSRAAKKGDEISALQLAKLHRMPRARSPVTGYQIGRDRSAGKPAILRPA